MRRRERVTITMEQLHSSKRDLSVERQSHHICSRVPSLMVGWGIGYWMTSLLYVLGASWDRHMWGNAPFIVTLVGYVVVPSLLLVGIFMLADPNILGSRFGIYIKRCVDILRSKRSVVYWSLATVLRDVVMLWVIACLYIRYGLYSANNGP